MHAAMLARGFAGVMPALERRRATGSEWVAVALVIVCFATITILALVTT